MKQSTKGRAASLALLCCAACPALAPENLSPPALAVRCAPSERASLSDVRVMRGTVVAAPDHDVVIAPQVAGRLVRVVGREGDAVRRGAVVAEVEVQPANDALHQARAQLTQAEAAAQDANVTFNRADKLFKRGIVARQQVDDTRAQQQETQAAVEVAQAAVDVATRTVARTTVRTPIDGVVVRILRRGGELVDGTPATPVLEVVDPAMLEFLASAQPSDLMVVKPGQAGLVRFDALPRVTFVVQVRGVAPVVDTITGVGTVRLTMLPAPQQPPLGLYGEASVDVAQQRSAVVIPPAALRSAWGGGAEVVVCDHGHAKVRAVEVGMRAAERVEILKGLAAGERVVTDNVVGLADNAAILEKAAETP